MEFVSKVFNENKIKILSVVGGTFLAYVGYKGYKKMTSQTDNEQKEISQPEYSPDYWISNQPKPLKVAFVYFKDDQDEKMKKKLIEIISKQPERYSVSTSVHRNTFFFQDVVFTTKLNYVLPYITRPYCFKVCFKTIKTRKEVYSLPKKVYTYKFDLMLIKYQPSPKKHSYYEGGIIHCPKLENFFGFLRKRLYVQWVKWRREGVQSFLPEEVKVALEENTKTAESLLNFSVETQLLTSTPGNYSFRIHDAYFVVTPTSVDKTKIDFSKPEHMVVGKIDMAREERTFHYWSEVNKPSIDAACQAILYKGLKHIKSFLHFHYGKFLFVFPVGKCSFGYPCGSIEEAREILLLIKKLKIRKKSFCIDMINHGFLIGLTLEDLNFLIRDWKEISEKIREIKQIEGKMKLFPVFLSYKIGGAILLEDEANTYTMYYKSGLKEKEIELINKEIAKRKKAVHSLIEIKVEIL